MNVKTTHSNNGVVHLPDAPAIPGLLFRRFRGEVDYPAMVAVLDGSKDADQLDEVQTVDDVARSYAHLNNCDPYQDMLFSEVDGRVIGYNRVFWWQESEGSRIYFSISFLLPEWRGKGIGRATLHYSERRLREIAAGHPADGPRFLAADAVSTQAGLAELLASDGYAPVRYFNMMQRENLEDIPEAPLPPGLEVRLPQPEHYRSIWDASQEAFQDHWGYAPETEEDYQSWLEDPDFDPSLWRVAWDGDQVAGMVLSFINPRENEKFGRQRGYTEGICVRRPWRRQGLARALLVQSLQAVKERGMTEAALGVDTENLSGAFRLYESVGFRPYRRVTSYRKPMMDG